ncbi:sensor histidine kinase [Rhodococcus rhodnii]|uniref:histidine kinase n=2 Tax=Rhodococcus rhodnii TaxID=38312 RepID=R7WUM8_9NOCA|nr:HAMP domain-containing sensor histidine kinase [Rhodococcus rhodnii]EOM77829.1 sensor kinase [Rhodococcus rhodnii LMG 5362]TXG88981.1 sensor histidine kinase [Rhodococcus rhodnii]
MTTPAPRRRAFSLRARVAVATGLGALIIVVALGVAVGAAIARNNLAQLDRRLEAASTILVPNAAVAGPFLGSFGDAGAFAITIRGSDGDVDTSTPTQLPSLDPGSHTTAIDGTNYRTYTAHDPVSDSLVSLAVPYAEAQDVTAEQQQQVAVAGVAAVAAATGLGWVFGGRAVRPLVTLTRRIASREQDLVPTPSGVREADELAAAAESMLRDFADAQRGTDAALATARDFAAVSAHELRTPLTAMRTDLEVLTSHELPAEDRAQVLADLTRAQTRVETTLADLERLARGELSTEKDFSETDLLEIADTAAGDAKRHHPGLTVNVDGPATPLRGLPAGLRLMIDNAVTNAARHGGAHTVDITITHGDGDGAIVLTVDDDGSGIAHEDRERVFERFVRGTATSKPGSGLGLALVAQQAALHGAAVRFDDSPLGGARLVVTFPGAAMSHRVHRAHTM